MNLVSGFLNSARRFPDRPTLEIENDVFTYAQLAKKVPRIQNAILKYSEALGHSPFICILAHRSLTIYAGILGILAAGKGYVPLNPKFPIERNQTMLLASKTRVLVVGNECQNLLSAFLKEIKDPLVILFPGSNDEGNLTASFPMHHFIFSDQMAEIRSDLTTPEVSEDSFAYMVFTSGSSGTPKGVPITHRNAASYVSAVSGDYNEHDRFSQCYDMTFDASMGDLFIAWQCGACVVCIPEHSVMAPAKIIRDKRLTHWDSVPSVIVFLQKLRMLKPGIFPSLKMSVFGGEPLTSSLAEAWQQAAPNSIIENQYGPTETTNATLRYRWNKNTPRTFSKNDYVPIGYPFPGQSVCLIDKDFQVLTKGETGELCISGSQVSLGYWNNPEKTDQQFVALPEFGKQIWYRTGDLCYQDEHGCFYFLGRIDEQVKIRGYRVELQEIESVLRKISRSEQAVAIAWPITNGSAEGVIAFLACENKNSENEILDGCRKVLPEFMVPRKIHFLDQMPLNTSGKIDRRSLVQFLEASK